MFFLNINADGFCPEYGVTFETSIIDKFEVAFGREGETMSLGCTVIVYPTVKKYQPDVVWYRNCKRNSSDVRNCYLDVTQTNPSMCVCVFSPAVPLKPSKWVRTHWTGERATLTLVHLNKEDEGLYTLRVNTKSGFDTHSAYVFVRGKDPCYSN